MVFKNNNWYIEELNKVKYAMRTTVKNKGGWCFGDKIEYKSEYSERRK
jgi:hypothetical protein